MVRGGIGPIGDFGPLEMGLSWANFENMTGPILGLKSLVGLILENDLANVHIPILFHLAVSHIISPSSLAHV